MIAMNRKSIPISIALILGLAATSCTPAGRSIPEAESRFRDFLTQEMSAAAKSTGEEIAAETLVAASTGNGSVVAAKMKDTAEPGYFIHHFSSVAKKPFPAKGITMKVVYVDDQSAGRQASLRSLSGKELLRLQVFPPSDPPAPAPLAITTAARPPETTDGQLGDDLYVCVEDGDNGTLYLNFVDLTCEESPTGEPECSQ